MSEQRQSKKGRRSACIIGCGGIGFQFDHGRQIQGAYTHFRAFMQSPFFDIAAVAEPNAAIRSAIEQEFGIPTFEGYRDMLEAVSPDVVSIAAPDHLHTGILRACADYRPAAVLCEKPLAGSLEEACMVVEKYRAEGIGLQVNFTRRFVPEFRRIAQLIGQGGLGIIQHVSIYYSRGLVHNASHYFDMLLFLFGEPDDVEVVRMREGLTADDPTATVVLRYEGFDVVLAGMTSGTLLTNDVDIVGTEGRVQVTTDDILVRSNVEAHPLFDRYTYFVETERTAVDRGAALPAAVDNIHAFIEDTEELLSPGANSIRIFQLINRIQEQPLWRNWHYSADPKR